MQEYTLVEQVKIRLGQYHVEKKENEEGEEEEVVVFDKVNDNPLISQLIQQAKDDVIKARSYPPNYTEEQINGDLEKYKSTIINLAVYDHSQAGEAYMSSYSENGVSRTWKSRNDLIANVVPMVNVLL
jgi:FtsZ-interacting cell division protein YlmF|nr:MAG TPA: hypothetical protein [Caudoviricetes sp.]